MRFSLRTLLILLGVLPPLLAVTIAMAYSLYEYNRTSVPPNIVIIDVATGETYVGPPK